MRGRGRREERGQATILIVGFATVIAMTIAMVIDASAAYLQRQGLNTLADGAALYSADLGATGEEVYGGGLGKDRLELSAPQARAAVDAYLREVGAHAKYPGLRVARVSVDQTSQRVTVELVAPLDLPLTVPGSPDSTQVGAVGSAVVRVGG